MRKFIEEFKDFALKGNVFDMAIGVVIGGAFTAIVNSLVTDVITPIISVITNTENLEKLEVTLRPALGDKEALVLRYGKFLDSIISFFIIAIIIFMAIKAINKLMNMRNAEEETEEKVEEPDEEIVLLTQILEELKKD